VRNLVLKIFFKFAPLLICFSYLFILMKFQTFKKIPIFLLAIFFLSATGTQAVLADSATAPNSGLTSNTSENWAGYVSAQNSGVYTAVSGSWNIPAPTATANSPVATDATWVGIGGVTGQDLIQSGTQAVVQNGAVTYEAWVETLPSYQQILPLTVSGGDSVSVSLKEISTGQWSLSFSDNTTGKSYQETLNYNSSLSSAEWIEEMPAGVTGRGGLSFLPLDNFGTVSFTSGNTTINGNAINISGSGASQLTMTIGGTALATPSVLSADGTGFSVTRSTVAVNSISPSASQPTIQRQGRGFRRNGVGVQGYTRPTKVTGATSRTFTRRSTASFSFQNFRNGFSMRFLSR
jgi:hypothetical protein